MDVVGAHVGERATPLVLELHPPDAPRARTEIGMASLQRLELGLLVGRDHIVVRAERDACKDPGVEVEDARRLGGERVTGKDPRPIAPGSIAAACSQRRTVEEEIEPTSPQRPRAARSCELHLDKGTSRFSGGSHANALIPATTVAPKRRGRPERGRSSRPLRAPPHRSACATSTPHRHRPRPAGRCPRSAPPAARSTMRARRTSACAAVRNDKRAPREQPGPPPRVRPREGEGRDIGQPPDRHRGGTDTQLTPMYLSAAPLAKSRAVPFAA